MAAAALAVLTGARGDDIADVIRTRKLELIGINGPALLSMSVDVRGLINFKSREGRTLLAVGHNSEGGGNIVTFDSKGTPLVRLDATTGGGGSIETYGRKGEPAVGINIIEASGAGAVATYGDSGNRMIVIGSTENGRGTIASFDRGGQVTSQWPY